MFKINETYYLKKDLVKSNGAVEHHVGDEFTLKDIRYKTSPNIEEYVFKHAGKQFSFDLCCSESLAHFYFTNKEIERDDKIEKLLNG